MLIQKEGLKEVLLHVLFQRIEQGCDLDREDFNRRIEAAADSYDGLYELALELRTPPVRKDWPYHEPVAFDEIIAECEHLRP